jgi:hypothetical protein
LFLQRSLSAGRSTSKRVIFTGVQGGKWSARKSVTFVSANRLFGTNRQLPPWHRDAQANPRRIIDNDADGKVVAASL